MKRSIRHLAATLVAGGRGTQQFLGARWIRPALRAVPSSRRRIAALWLLSLSPHYMFRTASNQHMPLKKYLEAEFQRNRDSRIALAEKTVKPYVTAAHTVLDYGCGPGFLAKAVSRFAGEVIACDISDGVLACAAELNAAPNIKYIPISPAGALPIDEATVDVAYCFAVIQHVSDDVFAAILRDLHRVLKPGAIVLCHIALDAPAWGSEQAWREDQSIYGRMKWQFGLHCFSRSLPTVEQMIGAAGFSAPEVHPVGELARLTDDLSDQHLFIFKSL